MSASGERGRDVVGEHLGGVLPGGQGDGVGVGDAGRAERYGHEYVGPPLSSGD